MPAQKRVGRFRMVPQVIGRRTMRGSPVSEMEYEVIAICDRKLASQSARPIMIASTSSVRMPPATSPRNGSSVI